MRAWAIAGCLAGCSFDPTGVEPPGTGPLDGPPVLEDAPDDDAPPQPAVRFRRPITIAADAVTGSLGDFPLYVELTDDHLAAWAADDGADLHFVDADGQTALDHELQAWDPATGHLEAWVRVPSLASGATIYLRYGAFAAPPAPDPAGVWQNGFVAVWHLDDRPSGAAGDVADARGAVDATSSGMDAGNRVDGVLGAGLGFDGADEQLTFANPIDGASSHTFSAWVDQDVVAHNSALVVIGDGACTEARWLHTRFTGGPVAAGFYCDDWTTTGVDLQGDGWTLVHWTYATSASRLYVDGALAAGPFIHANTQSTDGAGGYIGNAPAAFGDPMGLLGALDEVRIATVARSPAWIAAEQVNQATPSSFYAVGPEEPVP